MDMRLSPELVKTAEDCDNEIVQAVLEQVKFAVKNPTLYSRMHHRHYKTSPWGLNKISAEGSPD